MLFSLKLQRNDRQNALAIGSRESWRKRLYFHRAVEMKQPHPLTEPSKTIASYGRSHLLKNCFSTEKTTRLMVASLWEQCWQIWPFADGSVRVHGCFCFGNILKIYAFSQKFPLVGSVVGGFYWLFLWNFKEIKHQPFSMTQPCGFGFTQALALPKWARKVLFPIARNWAIWRQRKSPSKIDFKALKNFFRCVSRKMDKRDYSAFLAVLLHSKILVNFMTVKLTTLEGNIS